MREGKGERDRERQKDIDREREREEERERGCKTGHISQYPNVIRRNKTQ